MTLHLSSRCRRLRSRVALAGLCAAGIAAAAAPVVTVPGMPPVVEPDNLYSEAGAGQLSPRWRARCRASMCPTCARTMST